MFKMAEQKTQDKEKENFRYFVRIANTDLDGNKPIFNALRKIKGVSFMFSNMICNLAGIDKMTKAGYLSDEEIKKLDDILNNPLKYNAPSWMLNRRKDYETQADRHLVGVDLKLSKQEDIKRLQKTKSYRGLRHAWKLPVRGQRTRSNFRPNKGKVMGVKRRKGVKAGRV